MTDPVFNPASADGFPMAPEGGSDVFGATVVPVGKSIGLRKLGCMQITVAPGKRAFPFHNHLGADEMFVILEGRGTYRFGDTEHAVAAGDVCGAPAGGADTAHQLINTGTGPLRYLGISTMSDPEIVEYPDSGKYSAIAVRPGADFFSAHLKVIGRAADTLDYWDGEAV